MKSRPRKSTESVSPEALSYFRWNGTLSNTWAAGKSKAEILAFWKAHRAEILEWYIEQNRKGEAGRRPCIFGDELEEQGYKRRRTGTTKWIGPVRADGGDRTLREPRYESDLAFLRRLGEPEENWELEGKSQR